MDIIKKCKWTRELAGGGIARQRERTFHAQSTKTAENFSAPWKRLVFAQLGVFWHFGGVNKHKQRARAVLIKRITKRKLRGSRRCARVLKMTDTMRRSLSPLAWHFIYSAPGIHCVNDSVKFAPVRPLVTWIDASFALQIFADIN